MRNFNFLALLLFVPLVSYAQETISEYEFFGFSDDLKYVAFETFIPPPVADAGAYSKIIFVDVDKNDYATKPLNLSGKSGQETKAVRAMNKKIAQPFFAKYKITPGKNTGKKIPLKMAPDDIYQRALARDTQTFVIDNVNYTIELHSIETGDVHEALMIPKVKFELIVKYNGKTQVLQKDSNVPASRGFVTNYYILSAYHVGPKLVVFMEYDNPGFEGYPDRYVMVVTGLLGK